MEDDLDKDRHFGGSNLEDWRWVGQNEEYTSRPLNSGSNTPIDTIETQWCHWHTMDFFVDGTTIQTDVWH